jgi:hypothetical protein
MSMDVLTEMCSGTTVEYMTRYSFVVGSNIGGFCNVCVPIYCFFGIFEILCIGLDLQ